MSPKRTVESPRDGAKRRQAEGYVRRSGKGDHVDFVNPGSPIVTLDMGKREIPIDTLRMIYRAAGWTC